MAAVEDIHVRPIQSRDHDAWLPLWRGYLVFYKADIPETTSEVTWNRMLDPGERMFGALAFAGDKAVGMVHWLFHRTCWSIADTCYLQDLFVAPEQRGGGIGRRLIEHVYADARRQGSQRVYWHTHESNATARLLYDRIGDLSGFIQYRKPLS